MSFIRTLAVAFIGLGFAASGQAAKAGIMEGIVNQVFAQFEHDVKSAFTRRKPAHPQTGAIAPMQPTQYRRTGCRRILRR